MFTSDRERRLWLWAIAVVVAIYSTLGMAASFAGALRERGLLDVGFVAGTALIAAAIVAIAFRRRPGGAEIGAWLGIGAVYLMALVRMALPEERTHLVEYGVVALVVFEALEERRSNGRGRAAPSLAAFGVTAVFGALDELIQAIVPGRVFDGADIFVNFVAAAMALIAVKVLRWARGRSGRLTADEDRSPSAPR